MIQEWMGWSRPSVEKLAMEYVILCPTQITRLMRKMTDRERELLQLIQRRVGAQYSQEYINRARATLAMVGLE